jgi:ATP-dependent helicase HrpB
LQSKALPDPDESHRVQAICNAIKKEGDTLLHFDEETQEWQNRVMSLRKWRPLENWPDVSTPSLLMSCDTWLSPYLNNIKRSEDLKKLNLKEILHNSLDWEKQGALEKLAPTKIKVPTDSLIKLQYAMNGAQPVLAVRLQEVFGMDDTPYINEGKTPVIMHLLSPGYKPVQITSDLRSFWNTTYFEVKKELKSRYPKHAWPEDPLKAEAVRGVKKKL